MVNPVLAEGKRAPAFSLPSTQNGRFRLTEQRGRWVVVYFYPKDMTPGCTTEACDFQEQLTRFKRAGAIVVGISPGDLHRHSRFSDQHDLKFPLLVDRDAKTADRYGVWRTKKNNGREYQGLVRATFLVDPSGKIVRVWDNVRVKGHVDKVFSTFIEEKDE